MIKFTAILLHKEEEIDFSAHDADLIFRFYDRDTIELLKSRHTNGGVWASLSSILEKATVTAPGGPDPKQPRSSQASLELETVSRSKPGKAGHD